MRTGLASMGRGVWWRRFTRGPLGGLCLVLLCVAVYVPGQMGMPAIDRDESRFAQASRQMLGSESVIGWVVPKVQDRPRLNKPPLIYWMQAASAGVSTGRVFGASAAEAVERDAIWMYRLPSLLAAIVSVLITWRLGCSVFDPRAGFLGAMLLAVCPAVVWEARQARADMVLVLFTVAAVWGLWEAWSSARRHGRVAMRVSVGLWMAVALGVMTKGPVTLMVVGLGALCVSWLSRSWRWLWWTRPWLGVLFIGAMVGPWVYLVVRQVGFEEYWKLVADETVGRSMNAKEGHWGPPGYHAALLPFLMAAGSMLAGAALVRSWMVGWVGRREGEGWWEKTWCWLRSVRCGRAGECFLLAAVVPSWVVFELVSTKLPHYTMPLYPMLSLLVARGVLSADSGKWKRVNSGLVRWLSWAWMAGMGVAMVAFGAVLAFTAWRAWGALASGVLAAGWVGAAAFLVTFGLRFMATGAWLNAQRCGIAMMVGAALVLGFAAGRTAEIRLSRELALGVAKVDPVRARALCSVGYIEDSLIFETRGRAARVAPEDLGDWLVEHPRGLVCIEESQFAKRSDLASIEVMEGFNYSKGRWTKVHLAEGK